MMGRPHILAAAFALLCGVVFPALADSRLDVDYAELTRDPEAVMRKVAAFCGIDYIDAMRDPRSSTRADSKRSATPRHSRCA